MAAPSELSTEEILWLAKIRVTGPVGISPEFGLPDSVRCRLVGLGLVREDLGFLAVTREGRSELDSATLVR